MFKLIQLKKKVYQRVFLQKLDESTTLLSATCDSFIRTLEECMKLSNTSQTPQLPSDTSIPPITLVSRVSVFRFFFYK